MASTRRNITGNPKRFAMKNQDIGASDKEGKKDLSGSDQDARTPGIDRLGRRRPSPDPLERQVRAEVQHILETIGDDFTKILLEKRRRFEAHTSACLKIAIEKLENVWKIQKKQRQRFNNEQGPRFLNSFQQWDTDINKAEKLKVKLMNMFQQQKKIFQQLRNLQGQRLNGIKRKYEQLEKALRNSKKSQEHVRNEAQRKLKKELVLVGRKMLLETQQQMVEDVRKSVEALISFEDDCEEN